MSLVNETLNSSAPHLQSDSIYLDKKRQFLQDKIKALGKLCHEIDPYAQISEEHQLTLSEFGVKEFSDPFKVTNQLVVLLEDSIQDLENIENQQRIENDQEVSPVQ